MTARRPVVIIGAGGFGREVLDIVEALQASGHEIVCEGFLDDDPDTAEGLRRRSAGLLGPPDTLHAETDHVLAVGWPSPRAALDQRARDTGSQPASLIHPAATVGGGNRLGPGLLMAAGGRITTNVGAGRHLQVHTNATIGHDVVLGDHVTVSPGAHVGGNVRTGSRVMVGTGAVLLAGITIGDDVVVGAGAVVVGDVPPGTTVVGVPAREVERG